MFKNILCVHTIAKVDKRSFKFLQLVWFFIIHHVQNAIEKEHAKNWIIICLQILYFNNDFNSIRFDRECQFLQILNTFDMPLWREYGSYATRSIALEFLWALSEHLKHKPHFDVSKSHVFFFLFFLFFSICYDLCKGLLKNDIKSHLWASLKFDTLNALMQVSSCGTKVDNID